jgi:hypothetical protein
MGAIEKPHFRAPRPAASLALRAAGVALPPAVREAQAPQNPKMQCQAADAA